jgi:hypothetical protein
MKIKFLENRWIECCIGFDDDEEPIMEEEEVEKDEVFDVEIIYDDLDDDFIQIEFGNGSVSFIEKEWVEIEE